MQWDVLSGVRGTLSGRPRRWGPSSALALALVGVVGCGSENDEREPAASGGRRSVVSSGGEGGVIASGGFSPGGSLQGGAGGELPSVECSAFPSGFVDHACHHVDFGPFGSVAAGELAEAPQVSAPHTAYRVATESEGGWLRYVPSTPGLVAFFSRPDAVVEVVEDERVIPLAHRETTPCADLPEARVFELSGSAVSLRVSASVDWLVIERLVGLLEGCACARSGEGCLGDTDCCEGTCNLGVCVVPEPSGCDDGLALEESCLGDEECCSKRCFEGACAPPVECRSSGPCTSNEECCLYCHDQDHCH